jgi:murein DD-endopeptidase MepM/ murein hydrolase activator NlpD
LYQSFYPSAQLVVATLTVGSKIVNGDTWSVPVATAWTLTSPFGSRTDPVTGAAGAFHSGIDMAVPVGTPVLAAGPGTVTTVLDQGDTGYGRSVWIQQTDGAVTIYGHLSQPQVSAGQEVLGGQQIALSGSTGKSTGPHLHFEVRVNGTAVNPVPYMSQHGVTLDGTSGSATTITPQQCHQ